MNCAAFWMKCALASRRKDAFRDMAVRCRMPELTLLVAAIAQAMRMGTGLGHALRLQATEIRERRMAFIKEQAGKLPVKNDAALSVVHLPGFVRGDFRPGVCADERNDRARRIELLNAG